MDQTLEQLQEPFAPIYSQEMQKKNGTDQSPPPPPPKDVPENVIRSPLNIESYFNPLGLSRANSIYTLSRASLSNQLSQLTSLNLPEAASLSSSVSSIPTAKAATTALSNAAVQILRWIQKAAEVLGGLDAEDDVEWAAAGGREGLGEVDLAVGKFAGLVEVYVSAIEELQRRPDISKVPTKDLKAVVDTMETVLTAWEKVRKSLKDVKQQVELAMEWEELWNVVLGDIGLEMENLCQLVFEMEEKRHKVMSLEPDVDGNMGLNIKELETIVEESPIGSIPVNKANHRFSLPPAFPASSPLQSPGTPAPQDDSNLLALFARMQPLRASLDFLPMRLSTFQSRAEKILPTACGDLETRRKGLELKWKSLENDAEGLRRELGEDRWVVVFRTAGRQVQKLCESVERSITKLQEAIDIGTQHKDPAALARRVEAYEAKKTHYGPAIPRVLAIIEKGVNDRLTINGEILRLHADTQAMWVALEAEIKDMDIALQDLNMHKSQQLRDSISSIVSNDRSLVGSTTDTPGSSPASSVVMGPATGKKSFSSTPDPSAASRRSSMISSASTRPSISRRNISLPPKSTISSRTPHPTRSVTTSSALRNSSPCPSTSTPTPGGRATRPPPSIVSTTDKPRWNSSPKIDYKAIGHNFKPLSITTPSPHVKNIYAHRNISQSGQQASGPPPPSPLAREQTASPVPSNTEISNPRSRLAAVDSKLAIRTRRHTSPSPARSVQKVSSTPSTVRTTATTASSASKLTPLALASRRQNLLQKSSELLASEILDEAGEENSKEEESPSARPKLTRPATAMAGGAGRRSSMLPVLKMRTVSGREINTGGRMSVMGERSGKDGSMGEKTWR